MLSKDALEPALKTFAIAIVMMMIANAPAQGDWADPLVPFLEKNCASCHSGENSSGGLDLRKLGTKLDDSEDLEQWVQVHDRISKGEMPPKEEPPIEPVAVRAFLAVLSDALTDASLMGRRSSFRRLNRIEYENTVRDLFEIRIELKDMLPPDPTYQGFDTVGAVLSITPEQMEVYLLAAEKILDQVLGPDKEPQRIAMQMPIGQDDFCSRNIGRYFKKTDENYLVAFQSHACPMIFFAGRAKADGTYRMQIKAKVYQSNRPLIMAVYGGDVVREFSKVHLVGYYKIPPGDNWTTITFEDFLEPEGCYKMTPYNNPGAMSGPKQFKGPGLMFGDVSIEGPLEAWPPPSREKLLGKIDPKSANINEARQILSAVIPKAFRRPAGSNEVDHFLEITKSALDEGRPFLDALRLGLQAVLCSPEFLLREEPSASENVQQVSADALAVRMSYFLWSSMPDDDLFERAASKKLFDAETRHEQVERMLNDPRADRFVDNFSGQWLGLREIDATQPDARLYPEFDEMLRYAIVEETRRFFKEILARNESLLDFIDSNWAILNERLAIHYGIPGIVGLEYRRVELPEESIRGGVITQASVLKITANGTNTSPVVRGNWVVTNILGLPTPPPPSNVVAIEPDIRGATTIRQQLEKHRSIKSCSVCHDRIDPAGFALECFDPIGGYRDAYRTLTVGRRLNNLEIYGRKVQFLIGSKVDTSGQLPDGTSFSDFRKFKQLLREQDRQIARSLTEKLLIYALGRPLDFADRPDVELIVEKIASQGYGFRSLIHEIIMSKMFVRK